RDAKLASARARPDDFAYCINAAARRIGRDGGDDASAFGQVFAKTVNAAAQPQPILAAINRAVEPVSAEVERVAVCPAVARVQSHRRVESYAVVGIEVADLRFLAAETAARFPLDAAVKGDRWPDETPIAGSADFEIGVREDRVGFVYQDKAAVAVITMLPRGAAVIEVRAV